MTSVKVEVDFHLKADGAHNLALLHEIIAGDIPVRGPRVVATDGEVSLWAVVAAVDEMDGTMFLAVLWDEPVNAA